MRASLSLVVIPVLVMGFSQVQPSGAVCCPRYWILREDRCYRFIGKSRDWHAAQTYCNGLDHRANLVSLNSQDEAEFIHHLFAEKSGGSYSYYWIGLNDITTEGTYRWVGTNAAMTYSNWDSSEPNNRNNEDCGQVLDPYAFWNDWRCSGDDTHQPFICEMPLPSQ